MIPTSNVTPQKQDRSEAVQVVNLPAMSRGEEIIKQLEALVVPFSKSETTKYERESSSLLDYCMGFRNLNIPGVVASLKSDFPGEPFIAADIGGSYGSAALDLEKNGCDLCFVIDPNDSRTGSQSQLASSRFIQRHAENMEGVPDESFQFLVSFNSLYYSKDLAQSIYEISRVLRTGGAALIDIEWWAQGKGLEALNSLHLPENTSMQLVHFDRREQRHSLVSLAKALKTANDEDPERRTLLGVMMGTGFILQKTPAGK